MDESVGSEKVHRNFPIILPYRVTHVELIDLYMVDFEVVLRMD